MKQFNDILKSEIAKAERFATKNNGKKTQMTGWFSDSVIDEFGFVTVHCEMCSENMSVREEDVVLHVFMPDRRRSYAGKSF